MLEFSIPHCLRNKKPRKFLFLPAFLLGYVYHVKNGGKNLINNI